MSSPHGTGDETQPLTEVHAEAITACEAVVEKFRTGEISKARAVVEIQRHIPYAGSYDDEERLTAHTTAVGSFLRKLDSFERIRGIAATRGNDGEVERSTLGREGSAPADHQREEIAGGTNKRPHGESEDEETEDLVPSGRKLDVARLPWNSRKQPRLTEATALTSAVHGTDAHVSSILRTVEILETINVDLKRAKINLLLSLDVPQFPESQWTKLLSGGTADFDQVLSGLYASADVERTTERVGGLEFSYVSTAPTKRVTTFGDWTTAFDSFAEAFTFIFPHRGEELRAYAAHIKAFFKARPVFEHSGVIAYDSATSRFALFSAQQVLQPERPLEVSKSVRPAMEEGAGRARRPAEISITGYATVQPTPAITHTSAESAEDEGMWRKIVRRSKEFMSRYAPKYARDLVWFDANEDENVPTKQSLVRTSLSMKPVPSPPARELSNLTALETIMNYPHLFAIVTPVNVNNFEQLLRMHPNRPLVDSVSRSLREGFWPWASTVHRDYPDTYDNAVGYRTLTNPAHVAFAHDQCATEVAAGRFSQPFGPELLPGMYGVPVWVVPKPHSNGLRLVVDHSAGEFSLNSMIPKPERSLHLDTLQQLGDALIRTRELHGNRPLVVWKSDVSHAYRILPMHPLWQIKQTVVIDAKRHVDFDNNFGGGGSGRIWSVFFALVLWIATYIKMILDLFAYVDDAFSWDFANNLVWYEPYRAWYPAKQAKLLCLWDNLGIPHEKKKQEWGHSLVIIGLRVDARDMSVTMPDQGRQELIAALRAFAVPGYRRPLVEFQRLGGWVNWALNVYTLLRPGLNTLYAKIKDKNQPFQPLWVSKALCRELRWIARHMETSTGVYMLKSRKWTEHNADRPMLPSSAAQTVFPYREAYPVTTFFTSKP
ncbi:hypothetical protein FISHEDRAFT_78901 [Fistulina hepatica ATCC 64428]|uniref:Reverse transcriptase domain-containing protein n=1 Tax=Fistulina hepatica ATCC 64428 TaxID=1128425 RepID=A0A0D7A0W2_9AGAR|nr:hypothetical protein FISHEDRAFT_78901 [Fistulina hepatica ATCC 64428]